VDLKAWLLADLSDAEFESRWIELFEALYGAFSSRPSLVNRKQGRICVLFFVTLE